VSVSELLAIVLELSCNIALPWWVVRYDERRLAPQMLARTWNEASFRCAVVVFGPLALLVHFVRSRRSFAGLLLGAGLMAATAVLSSLVAHAAAALLRLLVT
jgi:hypothetical protein